LEIDPDGSRAICPFCGYAQPFLRLPLFLITGASGAGKSAITHHLAAALRGEAVVLETDILWRPEFATPEDNYRGFRETWLHIAVNVAQAGLPVVLIGTATREQFDLLPARRHAGKIHILALVAGDNVIRARLAARPAWRGSSNERFIGEMVRFDRWLLENADSEQMELLDTGTIPLEACVTAAARWFRERAEAQPSAGS
jgi:predicted kinase